MDHSSKCRLTDSYTLTKVVGQGSFGVVRKAELKGCAGITRAVKEVPKWNLHTNVSVRREASILQRLDHPHICRIFEIFEDANAIYLVMEFIDGRDLFEEIMESVKMNESVKMHRVNQPRYSAIMEQVFGALNYMHGHEIVHRDLKPKNIMVCQPSRDSSKPNIKIIDFGFAMLTHTDSSTTEARDTDANYLAPETSCCWMFTPASDMWSTGIIIFLMFQGRFPAAVLEELRQVHSGKARNLLEGLLQEDPKERLTAADAMRHPWVLQGGCSAPNGQPADEVSVPVQSLVEFYQSNKLKRAALTTVAAQATGDQIDALWDQFRLIDVDGNGIITKDELVKAFEAGRAVSPGHVSDVHAWAEALFDELDSDGSQEIEFTEWAAAALGRETEISESAMLAAFRAIDVDETGGISLENLRRLIHGSNEELQELMKSADLNGDGVIDFQEFKAVFACLAPSMAALPDGSGSSTTGNLSSRSRDSCSSQDDEAATGRPFVP